MKIACAERHFGALEVRYQVAKTAKSCGKSYWRGNRAPRPSILSSRCCIGQFKRSKPWHAESIT